MSSYTKHSVEEFNELIAECYTELNRLKVVLYNITGCGSVVPSSIPSVLTVNAGYELLKRAMSDLVQLESDIDSALSECSVEHSMLFATVHEMVKRIRGKYNG